MGLGGWRRARAARKARWRALQPTRGDVARQTLLQTSDLVVAGIVAFSSLAHGQKWTAIVFAALALYAGIGLIWTTSLLLRHRHPVQVKERAVCNECGQVAMPWSIHRHLRLAGHEAAGAHVLRGPDLEAHPQG